MLSRRNIRIKVMQVLYAMSRDSELTKQQATKLYRQSINKSYELYLFNLLQFLKVAEYAKEDYKRRQSKLRPSDEDKKFKPLLFENPLIQSLVENPGLQQQFRKFHLNERINDDNTRLLYNDFAKTEAYQELINPKENSFEFYRKVLLQLYKACTSSEHFTDLMEDHYMSWIDDKSLVVGAMKKTIKALPAEGDFYNEHFPDSEAVTEFGEHLLQEVIDRNDEFLKIIEPTLKNWDADRLAVIDMILLKMALCELLDFPTIPTKVTLNEFVEISKTYSTPKSKDFINGILDKLMKKLNSEGKIVKEGRGLIDE
ncbi:MAG: transcription antitermination factor NusB [Saprospirales bacterium]|nr:transcription antitermination factor NusB [Saprospirales bacterium]